MKRLILAALLICSLPSDAGQWLDVNYAGTSNGSQAMDVYTPSTSGPWPVVVFIHGGAWVGGSKNGMRFIASGYTSRGWAVALINYRLSPTNIWPTHLYDCKAAIRWLRGHAATYDISTTRIAAHGSSAGAQLAAMLALTNGNSTYEGTVGAYGAQSSNVAAAVLYAAPTDFAGSFSQSFPSGCTPPTGDPYQLYLGCTVAACPATAADASPLTHVASGAPPFMIWHGTADCVVPIQQSTDLRDALTAASVTNSYISLPGAGHVTRQFWSPNVIQSFIDFLNVNVP